jgi:late competence protein required for DNA uptake (superfamily II DNA/RNA helicase)
MQEKIEFQNGSSVDFKDLPTEAPPAKQTKQKVKLNRHQRRAREAVFKRLANQLRNQTRKPPRCPHCRSTNITYMTSQDAERTKHYYCNECPSGAFKESELVYSGSNNPIRKPRAIHSDGKVSRRTRKAKAHLIEIVAYP